MYLIMLNVKQGGIKYIFLSLWYDSTWDWTPVSWAIGELCIFTLESDISMFSFKEQFHKVIKSLGNFKIFEVICMN